MARFVPAHQHALMSLLAFAMFASFIGYVVWSAVRTPEVHADAGP